MVAEARSTIRQQYQECGRTAKWTHLGSGVHLAERASVAHSWSLLLFLTGVLVTLGLPGETESGSAGEPLLRADYHLHRHFPRERQRPWLVNRSLKPAATGLLVDCNRWAHEWPASRQTPRHCHHQGRPDRPAGTAGCAALSHPTAGHEAPAGRLRLPRIKRGLGAAIPGRNHGSRCWQVRLQASNYNLMCPFSSSFLGESTPVRKWLPCPATKTPSGVGSELHPERGWIRRTGPAPGSVPRNRLGATLLPPGAPSPRK